MDISKNILQRELSDQDEEKAFDDLINEVKENE